MGESDLGTCNLSKTKVAAHIEFPQGRHSLPYPPTPGQTACLTHIHIRQYPGVDTMSMDFVASSIIKGFPTPEAI